MHFVQQPYPPFYQLPPIRHRSSETQVISEESLPFYGGLKGQFLQVQNREDGSINTYILAATPTDQLTKQGIGAAAAASISITADSSETNKKPAQTQSTFEQDFNKIQLAAARLVAIQEMAKRKGMFSAEDNQIYANSLLELGQAAQSLAMLQQSGQIKDFSMLLTPDTGLQMPQKMPSLVQADEKLDEVTEQNFNEDDLLPPNSEDPYEDVNDSVAVTAPKKDASVAEAKPVGMLFKI